MIPRCKIVTIKFKRSESPTRKERQDIVPQKSCRRRALAGVVLAISICGCTPHGPRELLQGRRLLDRGKYVQAREKLLAATEILKTNAQAWNYLGVACHHAAEPAEAEKAYQRALLLDHDLSEAHFNLGCLYLEQNRPTTAKNELTAFSLRRGDSLEGLLMLGLAQLRCHEGAAAEKTFGEALRLSPQHPEALNGLGLARLQRGKPADALGFFTTALKVQPKYGPAALNAAVVCQAHLKDPRSALEWYQQFLAMKPSAAEAAAAREQIHLLQVELNPLPTPAPLPTPRPINHPAATQSSPTNPPAISVAPAISRYAYHNPPRGLPGNVAAAQKLFAQGSQAQQTHSMAEAIAAYRAAVQADPVYFEAWYNLAVSATEAGNQGAALAAYEQALAVRPESADARYNFALLLQQANYFQDAANELENVLARSPTEARAHLVLGSIYADQLHDTRKARQHYEKLLEVDPRNLQAGVIRSWLTTHPSN